ncbi:uncharacterized protein LOC144481742 [Mustelus asterias]
MVRTVRDALTDALNDLSEQKAFIHKLCESNFKGISPIRYRCIEGRGTYDIVDRIIKHYTEEDAAGVVIQVLEDINERQVSKILATDLEHIRNIGNGASDEVDKPVCKKAKYLEDTSCSAWEAIPYGQALRIHRICSDEEDRNRHLQTLKDALIRTGYGARLIDQQFQRATAKNRTDLLRRQTRDTVDRVPFVVQYFPGAEKLQHLLRSLQHVIDEDEHLAKAIPTPPLLAFKQPHNLKQTIVHSKLPSLQENSDHDTTQPCHSNLCKTCRIIDTDAIISRVNTIHQVHGTYSCNSANAVYLIRCRKGCPEAWYIGEIMQTLRQRMNEHRSTITRQDCSLPVGEHFSGHGHSASDLRVSVLQGGLHDTRQPRVAEQKLIAKFRTHEDGLNRDLGFMSHYL